MFQRTVARRAIKDWPEEGELRQRDQQCSERPLLGEPQALEPHQTGQTPSLEQRVRVPQVPRRDRCPSPEPPVQPEPCHLQLGHQMDRRPLLEPPQVRHQHRPPLAESPHLASLELSPSRRFVRLRPQPDRRDADARLQQDCL